jgi:hypothetical protein
VDFCYRCHLFQVNKTPTQVPEGELRLIAIPSAPFETLALDIAGPLPSDQKSDLILVVLDRFSGYTYLFPVSKNINAKRTAQILLDKIFTIHRYPLHILSDRDSQFTSHFWQQLMKNFQIQLQ